jgi:YD repeat-containing protein
VTQVKQGPSSSTYDTVYTSYDSNRRPLLTTIPYNGTAGQTGGVGNTTTYDGMGRVEKVLNSGMGYVQNTYGTATLNFTVLQQIGPDSNTGAGDTTKTKLFFYDGLGRLTSVCEVTSSTGGTCGGGAVQSGAVTSYVYDPLNSIRSVTQGVQTRAYAFDEMSRLTSETNPETGTVSYLYDSDTSTCKSTSQGDLIPKKGRAVQRDLLLLRCAAPRHQYHLLQRHWPVLVHAAEELCLRSGQRDHQRHGDPHLESKKAYGRSVHWNDDAQANRRSLQLRHAGRPDRLLHLPRQRGRDVPISLRQRLQVGEHDSSNGGANCGTVWQGVYSYDRYGNIDKSAGAAPGTTFQPTYNPTTNQYSSIPGGTVSYDGNGNLTKDTFHNYAWDADGNPTTIDTYSFNYDAFDRRVEYGNGTTWSQYVYSPTNPGSILGTASGQTLALRVPMPGGGQAIVTSAGLNNYRRPNWQGSEVMASSPTQTVLGEGAFTPFGEHYNVDLSGYNGYFAGNPVDFAGVRGRLCGDFPVVPLRSRAVGESGPGGVERGGPDESAELESVCVCDE